MLDLIPMIGMLAGVGIITIVVVLWRE